MYNIIYIFSLCVIVTRLFDFDKVKRLQGNRFSISQASYNLITRVLNDDQIFGIVSFASLASVVISPSMVGTDRQALTQQLPTVGAGSTSIGAGNKYYPPSESNSSNPLGQNK